MRVLEVCCGNLDSVHAAVRGGAPRIELCRALELDGLTPAWEDLRTARSLYPSLVIHVLIRPRPGDFCYSPAEVAQMASEVETALSLGADGIVIGGLTPEGDVDVPAMETLLQTISDWTLARSLAGNACHAANEHHFIESKPTVVPVTFHRAFDVCRKPFEALEDIISLGCNRILTSGQAPSADEGAERIRQLRVRAQGRLVLLPGGGVTPANAHRILQLSGCDEIHASASVTENGRKVTSADTVAKILQAIND